MKIAKGTYFFLSEGCYSSYSVLVACRATQDIDGGELRDEYLALHPKQAERYQFRPYQFAKWLIVDKRVCKEIPFTEWHVSDYSTVAEMWVGEVDRLE